MASTLNYQHQWITEKELSNADKLDNELRHKLL